MCASEDFSHAGHFFLKQMRRRNPNDICQIDAATREKETVRSFLSRCVRLARSLAARGLAPGDVLALAGPNHLSLRVPYYAAMLAGLPVVGVDPHFKYYEIKCLLKLTKPKIAFCQNSQRESFVRAAADLDLPLIVLTFDGDDNMTAFIQTYDVNTPIEEFEPVQFDPDSVLAWLVSTSGSTGSPKVAAFRHRHLANYVLDWMEVLNLNDTPEIFHKNKSLLNVSPVQWISGYVLSFGALAVGGCLVQTSRVDDVEHIIDVINEYKPTAIITSPSVIRLILSCDKPCDLTCFDAILAGGSKVYKQFILELRERVREDTRIIEGYGQTETGCLVMASRNNTPVGSCGPVRPSYKTKLMDVETGIEIMEPYKSGELWTKGPRFAGYYNDTEATATVITEDGWLKTGDILYRDEHYNYYFVERLKMLIKYQNYCIAPPELEELIMTHKAVQEAAVTGIPHATDGQRAVACVVRQPGQTVSAQEIMDLVGNNLSDSKRLRGGVIFLDRLPRTSTGKIARKELEELALTLSKE